MPVSDSVSQLLQGVCGTTLEDNVSKEEMKSSSIGQGYTEIFSSFFGGGSQSKAELKSATNTDPLLHSNGSADSSSHLPPVPVPNVQTFSPVLRVPAPPSVETSRNEAVPNPIGFVHSSASPFQLTQGHPWPPQQTQKTLPDSNSSESHTFQNVEFSPMVPTSQALNQSQQNQNYLGAGTKAGPESENRRFDSSIGFQSFGDSNSKTFSIGTIPKAQSSFDLPIRSTSEESLAKAPSFSNMAQPQVGSSSGPFLYQTRTGSVDSFKPIQPLSGVSSPPLASLNSGPLSSVPPTSSGEFFFPSLYISQTFGLQNKSTYY